MKWILLLSGLLMVLLIWRFYLSTIPKIDAPVLEIGKSRTIGSREVQEDDFNVAKNEQALLAVLADGMGKNLGGKIASKIAVDCFSDLFINFKDFSHPNYYFKRSFNLANKEILKMLDDGRGSAAVIAALIIEGKLYYALAGNCKIAIYRNRELIPLSEGHTVSVLASQQYYEGKITKDKALTLLAKQRMYNYLGQDEFKEIEIYDQPITLRARDLVVLMTDGIFEQVPWVGLENILSQEESCQNMCLATVETINSQKGEEKDNASIIMIRYKG